MEHDTAQWTLAEIRNEIRAATKAIKAEHGKRLVGIDGDDYTTLDANGRLVIHYHIRTVDVLPPLEPGQYAGDYYRRDIYSVQM